MPAHQIADGLDLRHVLRLRHDDRVQPRQTAERRDLVREPGAAGRIDPHGDELLPPVELAQRRRRPGERRRLLRRRHGVLEIHEHRVRRRGRGLADHLGPMRRHREIGAAEPVHAHASAGSSSPSSATKAPVCSPSPGTRPMTGRVPGMVIAGR